MTPKEKAEELYNLMYGKTPTRKSKYLIKQDKEISKQCALIAVDEILWLLNEISYDANIDSEVHYYQEVKQEIQKL